MKSLIIAFALIVPQVAFSAVYKCTNDGRTSFSDRPCGENQETLDIETNEKSKGSILERWNYTRSVDEMTDAVSCAVESPIDYFDGPPRNHMAGYLTIEGASQSPTVALRVARFGPGGSILHNDLSGAGIRVGDTFYPVIRGAGQKAAIFSQADSSEIIKSLLSGSSWRARARFWPYDSLYDTDPVSSAGFAVELEKFRSCR